MEKYESHLEIQSKVNSEARCFQAWVSFFTILKTLPKLEYPRYTEGFLLSIRNTTDLSLSTIISVVLSSSVLLCRVQKSVAYLEVDHVIRLLDRAQSLWPREKKVIQQLIDIIKENPACLSQEKKWIDIMEPDFATSLLEGRSPSSYLENFSRRPASKSLLEKVGFFPLVNKKLNS